MLMTAETPQMMKVMTVPPSSPTLLPRGEKGASWVAGATFTLSQGEADAEG
jgi:hypothetical protein